MFRKVEKYVIDIEHLRETKLNVGVNPSIVHCENEVIEDSWNSMGVCWMWIEQNEYMPNESEELTFIVYQDSCSWAEEDGIYLSHIKTIVIDGIGYNIYLKEII